MLGGRQALLGREGGRAGGCEGGREGGSRGASADRQPAQGGVGPVPLGPQICSIALRINWRLALDTAQKKVN